MFERDVTLLLQDILESMNNIKNYTSGMTYEDFLNDQKTVDAVARNFEIIGEAANKIPRSFQAQYLELQWHRVISLRNRIIHDYFDVDYEIVWKIIHSELEQLKEKLEKIMKELHN